MLFRSPDAPVLKVTVQVPVEIVEIDTVPTTPVSAEKVVLEVNVSVVELGSPAFKFRAASSPVVERDGVPQEAPDAETVTVSTCRAAFAAIPTREKVVDTVVPIAYG